MTERVPALGDNPEEDIKAIAMGAIGRSLGLSKDDIKPGLVMAKGLMDAGRVEKAFEIYTGLVLLEPTNVDVQLGLANCAVQLQRYSLAIQAASVAMIMDPTSPRPYYFSGVACLALGHFDEAKEDLTDVLKLAKDRKDAEMLQSAKKLLDGLVAA
ncbi:tetratricopeptide repeat protein [Pseudovibrio sp. Tun.PSC04-5.I4]|uniref:tetratricopeptide repeat protein n=1 Tax=Pseudovibrio sp. Tun.PSC04-5.I4 TaxID=1798213 RepID=UPI0008860F92|nr:tetratricopeptide repeat protein [Pseudovibrio sp. Tun.PSC04-5.I4]SDR15015.1 Tetratricopeptide repeat-containing protein [Pseudovibrio sp. Tun.PSC04-5.I4]